MNIAGIVAEYNPFHTGHQYQIQQTRALLGADAGVVAVMSGNWVQQANCAIADKWTRAKLALMGGADLVLELPTVWATASAEGFCQGAVDLLIATGVVDTLSFGSECGDTDCLEQVAACLTGDAYQAQLKNLLSSGLPFAVCRQKAVEQLLGSQLSDLLSTPNNNLGIEYIRALRNRNSTIRPMTVLRRGAAHNSISSDKPDFLSATQIRRDLNAGVWETVADYLVPGSRTILESCSFPSMNRIERVLLARMRTMSAQDWAVLPDSGAAEGLPQRLERAGRQCTSIGQFLDTVKTKRYTHARLRRLLLWVYLGISAQDRPKHPPYLRVLGFNQRGQEILARMRKEATLPILTKPAHSRDLDNVGQRLFELEARCTDLYDLCLDTIPAPGRVWTQNPVILKQKGI